MSTVRGGRKLKNISLILVIRNIFNISPLPKLSSNYTTFSKTGFVKVLFSHLCYFQLKPTFEDSSIHRFQAFFQRWWAEKSPKIKAVVQKLVGSGQLEFMYGT
jgi:hypothetical protein